MLAPCSEAISEIIGDLIGTDLIGTVIIKINDEVRCCEKVIPAPFARVTLAMFRCHGGPSPEQKNRDSHH
jgi:hypothetical protein